MTLPPKSILDVASYVDPLTPAETKLAAKTVSVGQKAAMKALLSGTPETQQKAIEAVRLNLPMADEVQRDAAFMSRSELIAKYGEQIGGNTSAFDEQTRAVNADRATPLTSPWSDFGVDVANSVAGAVTSAVSLFGRASEYADPLGRGRLTGSSNPIFGMVLDGASALSTGHAISDPLANPQGTAFNELTAKGSQAVSDYIDSYTSENAQTRAKAAALTSGVLADQRDATYDASPKSFADWVQKQVSAVGDTGSQIMDDPSMQADLAGSAVGSILPVMKAAKLSGAANVASASRAAIVAGEAEGMAIQAAKKGYDEALSAAAAAPSKMADEAVKASKKALDKATNDFAKSEAGKQAFAQGAETAAVVSTGLMEGGSAANQSAMSVFNAPIEELRQNAEFQALQASGYSEDDARSILASRAGNMAAPIAAIGGAILGKLTAPFAAKPFSVGSSMRPGSAALGYGLKVVKEGAEEFGQGANNQFASNVGLKFGAGMDVNLDQGVAEAGTAEAIGGAFGAGLMSGPQAAIKTGAEAAVGAVNLGKAGFNATIGKGLDAAAKKQEAKRDAKDPLGSTAQAEAGQVLAEGAAKIQEALVTEPAPVPDLKGRSNLPNAKREERKAAASAALVQGAFVGDAQAKSYAVQYPDLAGKVRSHPDAALDRAEIIMAAGSKLKDTSLSEAERIGTAMDLVTNLEALRSTQSDAVRESLKKLGNTELLQTQQGMGKALATLEAAAGSMEAVRMIKELTPEKADAVLGMPIQAIQAGQVTAEQKASIASTVEAVARLNISAVRPEYLDAVRNMIEADTSVPDSIKKSIGVSADLLAADVKAKAAKAEIEAAALSEIGALPNAAAKDAEQKREETRLKKSMDIVSQEIHMDGNSGLLSLSRHREVIGSSMASGQIEAAKAQLDQLRRFAVTQVNKVNALNKSIASNKGERVGYMAYGPYDEKPYQAPSGLNVALRSPSSKAFAREVWLDTHTAATVYNSLVQAYGKELDVKEKLSIPELDRKAGSVNIDSKPMAKANRNAKPKPAPKTKVKPAPVQETPSVVEDVAPEAAQQADQATGESDATSNQTEPVQDVAAEPAQADTAPQEEDLAQADEPASEGSDVAPVASNEATGAVKGWIQSMKDSLVGETNRFLEAFRPSKTVSSLFLAHESARNFLLENLDNLKTDQNAMTSELTAPQRKALQRVLEKDMPKWIADFVGMVNKALDEKIVIGGKPSTRRKEILAGNQDMLSYPNTLPLNLLERDGKDSLAMSPQALEATFMSALQYVLENASGAEAKMDDDRITDLLGVPRGTRVTDKMRDAASSGLLLQGAVADIAKGIENLLGVSRDGKASMTFTQGITTALANNALSVLAQNNVIQLDLKKFSHRREDYDERLNQLKAKGEDPYKGSKSYNFLHKPKSVYAVTLQKPARGETASPIAAMSHAFAGKPDIFDRVFGKAENKKRFVGAPPKDVQDSLIRNKTSKLSPLQYRVVKQRQNVAHYLNTRLMDTTAALGTSFLKEMLGYVELKDREHLYNDAHLTSIRSKNLAIEAGIEGVRGFIEEAKEVAAAEGKDGIRDVQIFFRHSVSSVGRLQQDGPITPQGDKIAREMISPIRDTLDLSEKGKDLPQFIRALAQNMGVKVERKNAQDILADLLEISSTLEDVFVTLSAAIASKKPLTADEKKAFKTSFEKTGQPFTMKMLHASQDLIRYQLPKAEGNIEGLKNFESSLSFEADGITDGMINAMVHMFTGSITAKYLKNLAKGGLFFTGTKRSINQHKQTVDKEDLYTDAASRFVKKLREYLGGLPEGSVEAQYATSLLRVMAALVPDFRMQASEKTTLADMLGSMEATRNLLKNPLTVFIYGSSVKGIAGKIFSQMEERLSEVMSEVLQGRGGWQNHPLFAANPKLASDLQLLMAHSVDAKEGTVTRAPLQSLASTILRNPKEAAIFSGTAEEMIKGITTFFAGPMAEAIDETTGGLASNMQLQQTTSRIQNVIFTRMFNERLKRLMDDRKAAGTLGLPTESEVRAIFVDMQKVAPIYLTGTMSFFVSNSESWDSDYTVSQDLAKNRDVGAAFSQPAGVSVKVSPYMTIGMGDGQMVMRIYAEPNGDLQASIPVFDGIELGIGSLLGGSAHINSAVWKAWMEDNAFASIAESFAQTLNNMDLSVLTDKDWADIGREAGLGFGERANVRHLNGRLQSLQAAADDVAARKAAMKSLHAFIDHMGGAEQPHENVGDILPSDRVEDVAVELEKRRKVELAKIKAARKEEKEAMPLDSATVSERLAPALAKVRRFVKGFPEVARFGAWAIRDLVTKETGATVGQIALMKELVGTKKVKDFTFYHGSSADLTQVKTEVIGSQDTSEVQQGQILPGRKTILLTNLKPETVLHELVHAYVADSIDGYFQNPEGADENTKGAVKRLLALKGQFIALVNNERLKLKDPKAVQAALQEMTNPSYTAAVQLEEFMAYVLSNAEMRKLAAGERITSNLAAQIGNRLLGVLKQILGIKGSPGNTLLSNLEFNARVLVSASDLKTQSEIDDQDREARNMAYGPDGRLKEIEETFTDALDAGPRKKPLTLAQQAAIGADIVQSHDALKTVTTSGGFALNPRQGNAFMAVHGAMISGMSLDARLGNRLAEAYALAVDALTPEAYLKEAGLTRQTANRAQIRRAERKAQILSTGASKSGSNKPDTLATMVALAQVDPETRAVLERTAISRKEGSPFDSVDSALRAGMHKVGDIVTDMRFSARRSSTNVIEEIDRLSMKMAQIRSESRVMAALQNAERFNPVEYLNTKASGALETVSGKLADFAEKKSKTSTNRAEQATFGALQLISSFGSKNGVEGLSRGMNEFLASIEGLHSVRALMRDLTGATKNNRDFYKLLNQVKTRIDKVRQGYRNEVPEALANAFSRRLTKDEWSNLHAGLGQADMAFFGSKEGMRFLGNSTARAQKRTELEEQISALTGGRPNLYLEKANALATYMVTGQIISNNLQPNALAIAKMFGERREPGKVADYKALEETIDALVSLMAYDMLEEPVKTSIEGLTKTEQDGMQLLLGYHSKTRQAELSRLKDATEGVDTNKAALHNGRKGYVPVAAHPGHALIVANKADHNSLVQRGWTKVADYDGDLNDRSKDARQLAYYRSSVAGKNMFRQGIAQIVHTTWQGVDVRTGVSKDDNIAGVVLGANMKLAREEIHKRGTKNNLPPGEYLLPVFDRNGNIAAYQRPMKAELVRDVPKDDHLGRMLGSWSGRIIEESMANQMNDELVGRLKEAWDRATATERKNAFVNVASSADPVIKDAWDTLGWRIKETAKEAFGEKDTLMVHRTVLDDVMGYRAPGVTDIWTGTTRMNAKFVKGLQEAVNNVFGDRVFEFVRTGEEGVQTAVSFVKENVVVRSVSLLVDNFASNALQLVVSNGVSVVEVFPALRKKFSEISTYARNEEQIRRLEVLAAGVSGDKVKTAQIEGKIQVLRDMNSRLSILPLIEAGEFGTISENLSETDVALREGRIASFIGEQVDRLPGAAKGVLKNAVLTRDSALFQTLNRGVQYGDFIAKAVLFDHLISKGMSKEDALAQVSEEFVNYNRLPGRGREYLESMGMLWFANYAIRSTKVAGRILRERPLTALFMAGGVSPPFGLETSVTSALPYDILSGQFWYKVGPELGIDNLIVTPWSMLFGK